MVTTTHSLSPVPDSLRELARRQLDNPATSPYQSTARLLIHLARLHRNMQDIMLERQKSTHSLTHAANPQNSEWSRILVKFDQSRRELRAAYDAHLAAAPLAAQTIASWRTECSIATGQLFTHEFDDDELVLHLRPTLALVWSDADALLRQALERWMKATTDYFHLLTPSRLLATA